MEGQFFVATDILNPAKVILWFHPFISNSNSTSQLFLGQDFVIVDPVILPIFQHFQSIGLGLFV